MPLEGLVMLPLNGRADRLKKLNYRLQCRVYISSKNQESRSSGWKLGSKQ